MRTVIDYTRSVDLVLNEVFVCPEDGFIGGYAHYLSNSHIGDSFIGISIVDENNNVLYHFCDRCVVSTGTNAYTALNVPVAKGDRILLDGFTASDNESFI